MAVAIKGKKRGVTAVAVVAPRGRRRSGGGRVDFLLGLCCELVICDFGKVSGVPVSVCDLVTDHVGE